VQEENACTWQQQKRHSTKQLLSDSLDLIPVCCGPESLPGSGAARRFDRGAGARLPGCVLHTDLRPLLSDLQTIAKDLRTEASAPAPRLTPKLASAFAFGEFLRGASL